VVSGGHYFISYSRVDAAEFAVRLADQLAAGPPPYPVWLDARQLQPGPDWDDQLVEAIRGCRGLLFAMTEDSVRAGSVCKQEWVWALKYKKPVIPLRAHAQAELPFRLGSRQYVDFSRDFGEGLAKLRVHLAWTGGPEGALRELEHRLADAERELPRADPGQRSRIEEDIHELRRRITEQRQLIDDPAAAKQRTKARIDAAVEAQQKPERPTTAAPRARFVNPPPMTAPGYFQDRLAETGQVGDFLRAADARR
jgi:hypothetical protein